MKYYKIVNPKGNRGLVYHEGLNIDPKRFKPYGDCESGGIYFAREDILAFLDYGTELYEVEPIGKIYENPGRLKKWKCKKIKMKHLGNVCDNIPFLIEHGADIHANYDWALTFSATNLSLKEVKILVECGANFQCSQILFYNISTYGRLDILKYLVECGMNVNEYLCNRSLIRGAGRGDLDMVKYLVELGANIHVDYDDALRSAAWGGHTDVVKYLVEMGADIHAYDDEALRWAANNGHTDIVKYLVEHGANIHARGDEALRWAANNSHTDIVKYIKSLK